MQTILKDKVLVLIPETDTEQTKLARSGLVLEINCKITNNVIATQYSQFYQTKRSRQERY